MKPAIFNQDGTYDQRYSYLYNVGGTFTTMFCNITIGKACSLQNAILAAKRHQTRQMLGVYCG